MVEREIKRGQRQLSNIRNLTGKVKNEENDILLAKHNRHLTEQVAAFLKTLFNIKELLKMKQMINENKAEHRRSLKQAGLDGHYARDYRTEEDE